jgi:hypothetical protein
MKGCVLDPFQNVKKSYSESLESAVEYLSRAVFFGNALEIV